MLRVDFNVEYEQLIHVKWACNVAYVKYIRDNFQPVSSALVSTQPRWNEVNPYETYAPSWM